MNNKSSSKNIPLLIIVAALGYFVDIYDLLLFLIVKNKSLMDLGVSATDLTDTGLALVNWQMAGLLSGGILWGILGDKKGRLTVLFGSILMYSLANIAKCVDTTLLLIFEGADNYTPPIGVKILGLINHNGVIFQIFGHAR